MSKQKSLYGIIGNPVKHSLSPLMHNLAFRELGVEAEYKLFPLNEDELETFFKDLRDEQSPIFGLNVTVPFKETVLKHLDTLTPFAQKVGAVNTIVINEQRKLFGYNTDAPGFLAHLNELKFDTAGKRIAILGAGGTARAIIATLCMIKERPTSIKVYNRSAGRLNALLGELKERIDLSNVEAVNSIDDLNVELADLLINTTSLGLNETDDCLVDDSLIHANMLVYDLIYNPPETRLLKIAKKKRAQTANGLGMLFYQGVLSLQHWANVQLDDDIKIKMRASLKAGVQ